MENKIKVKFFSINHPGHEALDVSINELMVNIGADPTEFSSPHLALKDWPATYVTGHDSVIVQDLRGSKAKDPYGCTRVVSLMIFPTLTGNEAMIAVDVSESKELGKLFFIYQEVDAEPQARNIFMAFCRVMGVTEDDLNAAEPYMPAMPRYPYVRGMVDILTNLSLRGPSIEEFNAFGAQTRWYETTSMAYARYKEYQEAEVAKGADATNYDGEVTFLRAAMIREISELVRTDRALYLGYNEDLSRHEYKFTYAMAEYVQYLNDKTIAGVIGTAKQVSATMSTLEGVLRDAL